MPPTTDALQPAPSMVFDGDSHLYEPRTMWQDNVSAAQRHLALRLEEDDAGHTWLATADRRLHLAEVHVAGDIDAMGDYRASVRAGQPQATPYDEALPKHYWDPSARVEKLDLYGIDQAVVFPQYGLMWERQLADDLEATLVNMEASNRWARDVRVDSRGRLHPVGRATLRDLDWLDAQLAELERADIRLVMIAPALVDDRPLSHPTLDRAWDAFTRHGISPCFHVAASGPVFRDGWYVTRHDRESVNPHPVTPMMSAIFMHVAPAVAIADMTVNGVFARHPALRLGVMELTTRWVPEFLDRIDGVMRFHARFNGLPELLAEPPPSEAIREHVRVAVFAEEGPAEMVQRCGDLFMYTSDYPHAEGLTEPVDDYLAVCGRLSRDQQDQLFSGNVRWLLRDLER